jgi:hypothetical protein
MAHLALGHCPFVTWRIRPFASASVRCGNNTSLLAGAFPKQLFLMNRGHCAILDAQKPLRHEERRVRLTWRFDFVLGVGADVAMIAQSFGFAL